MKAKRCEDLTGRKFGRLTAIKGGYFNGQWKWQCECECGGQKITPATALKQSLVKSCGCLSLEGKWRYSHQLSKSREYDVWKQMKQRCFNPKCLHYHNYGGRGITVCKRWLVFENFYADMGPRPSAKHSIERINNDGNYEPKNCHWATRAEQNRNHRGTRIVVYKGKRVCMKDMEALTGIPDSTLWYRMKVLGDIERAVSLKRSAKMHTPLAKNTPIKVGKKSLTLTQWASQLDIKYGTLCSKIAGHSPAKVIKELLRGSS